MKILFLGGYGNISWWCTKKAIELGHDVYLLNRSLNSGTRREIPEGAKNIIADYRDLQQTKNALKDYDFDVVCDFICYHAQEAKDAIELFRNKTKQYIVISSAGNYDRKNAVYPLTESCSQYGIVPYITNKIEMEEVFLEEYKNTGFPVTIVRPGQTYDTLIPDCVGNADFTNAQRILDGKPIIVLGEGTTLWTLTHSRDFANAFVHLFGNAKTIGEAYHITSDELLSWNQIIKYMAEALGVKEPKVVHMSTSFIEKYDKDFTKGLRSHKIYTDIFDNSKIKTIAKDWQAETLFKEGIVESIQWLLEDKRRQRINKDLNELIDTLCLKYEE